MSKSFSFFDSSVLTGNYLMNHIQTQPVKPIIDPGPISLFDLYRLHVQIELSKRSALWVIERQQLLPSYLRLTEKILTFFGSKVLIYNDPFLKDNEVIILDVPKINMNLSLDF